MKRKVITQSRSVRPTRQRTLPRHHGGTVRRQKKSRRDEREWQRTGRDREGEHYAGYFQAAGRQFAGKAILTPSGLVLHVRNVPAELLTLHSHRACFMPRKDGWFEVHHENRNATLDSAIFDIEQILTESLTYSSTQSPSPLVTHSVRTISLVALLKKAFGL